MQNTKKISVKDILLMGMGESVAPKKVAKTPKARPCDVSMLAESYAYIMSDVEKRKYQVLAMSHYSTVKLATGEDAKAVLDKVKKAGSKVKDIVINLLKALGRFLREAYNYIMGKIRAAKTVAKDAISRITKIKGKKVELPNYDKNIVNRIDRWVDLLKYVDLKEEHVGGTKQNVLDLKKLLGKMNETVMDAKTAPTTQDAEEALKYFKMLESNALHRIAVLARYISGFSKEIDAIRKQVQADKDAQNAELTEVRSMLPDITKSFNEVRSKIASFAASVTASFKFKEVKEK